MKPRKILAFLLIVIAFLLPACGPELANAIQTAIAQTEEVSLQQTQEVGQLLTQATEGCGDTLPPVGFELVIGDFVWFDENGNNLQDPGEPGVADVPVQLFYYGVSVADKVVIANTITDSTGHYYFCIKDDISDDLFDDLRVLFGAPPSIPDYTWVDQGNTYTDWEIDSDARSNLGPAFGQAGHFAHIYVARHLAIQVDAGIRFSVDDDAKTAEAATATAENQIRVTGEVNCRSGPGSNYAVVTTFSSGDRLQVVALFPPEYVVVRLPDGRECWLWLEYTEPKDFSDANLPEATQPPTPTPHPTETPRPTKTPVPSIPTPTPTPTRNPIG